MDEILASIRRIIEDNDAGQPSATSQEDVLARVNDAFQATEAANRPQLNAVINKEYAPEIIATSQPSDAEFSADDGDHDLTEVPATVQNSKPMNDKLEPHQKVSDAEMDTKPEADVFTAAIEGDKAAIMDIRPVNAEKGASSSLSNMISSQAAERVSASFGALTEAVDATKESQLENMTESMLKPMLQEWLDNNLPVIVERLVREEIERLARGEM